MASRWHPRSEVGGQRPAVICYRIAAGIDAALNPYAIGSSETKPDEILLEKQVLSFPQILLRGGYLLLTSGSKSSSLWLCPIGDAPTCKRRRSAKLSHILSSRNGFRAPHRTRCSFSRNNRKEIACTTSSAGWLSPGFVLYGLAKFIHQTSDKAVDEAIFANEYTFTPDGRRFG